MQRQHELAVVGGTAAALLGVTLGLLVWLNIPANQKKETPPP